MVDPILERFAELMSQPAPLWVVSIVFFWKLIWKLIFWGFRTIGSYLESLPGGTL